MGVTTHFLVDGKQVAKRWRKVIGGRGGSGLFSKPKMTSFLDGPLSPPFFSRCGWNLGWASPCPNPDPTPIFIQMGRVVPEKWLILWMLWNKMPKISVYQLFLWNYSTDLAEIWCGIRVRTGQDRYSPNLSHIGWKTAEIIGVSLDMHMFHLTCNSQYMGRFLRVSHFAVML